MPDQNPNLQPQRDLLKQLFDEGLLTEDQFRTKLQELEDAQAPTFNQREQQVEQQLNIAGNLVVQAAEAAASGDQTAQRRSYLSRVFQQTRTVAVKGTYVKKEIGSQVYWA